MKIYDLIYCYKGELDDLKEIYPDAIIKDATDITHPERTSFEVEDDKESYYRNIIKLGYGSISFLIQVAIYEETKLIRRLLDEIKKEEGDLP